MDNSKFDSDDLDRYRTVFSLINKGGEEKITRSTIEDVLRNKMGLDISDATLDAILKEMNADERGDIDFESFMKTMKSQKRVKVRLNDVCELFRNLDEDGDGEIGPVDWKLVFEKFGLSLTESEVSEVMKRASTVFQNDDVNDAVYETTDEDDDGDVFYDAK